MRRFETLSTRNGAHVAPRCESMSARTLTGALSGVELCQATYVHHHFPLHAHPEVHIALIESGRYAFRIHDTFCMAETGDLVILAPDEPHDGGAHGGGGFSYRQILIPSALWDSLVGLELGVVNLPKSRVLPGDGNASRFLRDIFSAYREQDMLQLDFGIASLAVQLALKGPMEQVPRLDSKWCVDHAIEIMHSRFSEPITVAELAAATCTNRFSLLRAFKRRYGLGIHEWLMGLRLRHARRYLADGMSAAEVAAACGFTDQSHLLRRFKSIYGITPGRFSDTNLGL